jgi:hypothetical protein
MGLTLSAMMVCRARGAEANERWLCCSFDYLGLVAAEALIEYHVMIFLLCFVEVVQSTYALSLLLGVGLGLLVLGGCIGSLVAFEPKHCPLPFSVLTFFIVAGPLFVALGQMSIKFRQRWYDSVVNFHNVSSATAKDVVGLPKLIRFMGPVVTLPSLMYSLTAPPSNVPLLYCQHKTGVRARLRDSELGVCQRHKHESALCWLSRVQYWLKILLPCVSCLFLCHAIPVLYPPSCPDECT